jgi:hypothetical protein
MEKNIMRKDVRSITYVKVNNLFDLECRGLNRIGCSGIEFTKAMLSRIKSVLEEIR